LNVIDYHHNNKLIAVVDDEEDNVTLFTKVIQENGYHVMGFTNPFFILDYIRKYPDKFSLIIVDYRVFPMQGSALANKISTINPKIKMVLITAYENNYYRRISLTNSTLLFFSKLIH
jgi:DNA-binding NtrC family response regulator